MTNKSVAISMFSEHGYPHVMRIDNYQFLEGPGRVSFLVVDGDAWSIFRTCFWLVVPFLGEQEFLRTVFFAAPEYQVQYSTGCRLCVLKRSKNIMKHIDLSPKQRIFKCTVPKVTLNPGNLPLQLLLVGELRSCITFKFHLH